MSTDTKADQVAHDFPVPAPAACVAGSHAKVLVEECAGQYLDDARHRLLERYEICDDLLRQLIKYTKNKLASKSCADKSVLLDGVTAKVNERRFHWQLSVPEVSWIALHLRQHILYDSEEESTPVQPGNQDGHEELGSAS